MSNDHNRQIIQVSTSELLILKSFKMFTIGKTNEAITVYGLDNLPSMLHILTCRNRLNYTVESVKITPNFVGRVVDGSIDDIVAFTYVHKLLSSDKNGEVTKKVAVYYEDNLVRITHYHTPVYNMLTDAYVINERPDESKYNEFHPAMLNISNLLSIN